MLQKQLVTSKYCGVVIAVLLLLCGCGKKKTQADEKAKTPLRIDKSTETVKSGKIKSINVAGNPSFEEAKAEAFNKNAKFSIKKPLGWITTGQFLNNSSGWDSEEAHSGKYSLKIENIGGTDAYWKGEPVILKENANALEISIWTKTKDLINKTGQGKFQLVFDIYIKGDNNKEIRKRINLALAQKVHDWEKFNRKVLFAANIVKIVPFLYFSKMTGTVWFDDFSINPMNIDISKGKALFDSNNKKSKFNIRPLSTPVSTKRLSAEAKSESKAGKATIYEVKGSKDILSTDFIPVEEGKVYKLSGDFKITGKEPGVIYFGYAPYAKDKKAIRAQSVNYIEGTATELAKACKPTDKVIYINNARNWKTSPYNFIAFETDNSGKYSDLPNSKLSSMGIDKIVKIDGVYELKLKKACGKNYPAGTKIREHIAGSSYIYNAAKGLMLHESDSKSPGGFKNLNNIITTSGSSLTASKFYPKTKYIKLVLLANYRTPKAVLRFKNIKVEKIDFAN